MIKIRKYRDKIIKLIIGLAIILAFIAVVYEHFYVLLILFYLLFGFIIRNEVKKPLFFLSICFIINLAIVSYLPSVYLSDIASDFVDGIINFVIRLLFSLILLLLPYYFIYKYYMKASWLQGNASEKDSFLICIRHNSRTNSVFLNSEIIRTHCRADQNCYNEKNFIYVNNIVGVIGKKVKNNRVGENYYVQLWDDSNDEIINGDYDIIEIYENKKIQNYDALVSRLISFLYNEFDRHKAINQIYLRVFGNPGFTNNTKRLLEKHFLKVEYE